MSANCKPCMWDCGAGDVALLSGGQERSYLFGLATSLSERGIRVNVLGNEHVDNIAFHTSEHIRFIDLGSVHGHIRVISKLFHLVHYYGRMIVYLTFHSPKVIHILWNSKAEYFDRTFLMLYLKCLGKKVALTAHNINKAKRDSCDSLLNRMTLTMQYRTADAIFVHTEKMKEELVRGFGVRSTSVVLIPFGTNIAVPDTSLSADGAKCRLGIRHDEKAVLFFGRIVPYKGVEYLIEAFQTLARRDSKWRLVIAGEPMQRFESYVDEIRRAIANSGCADRITCRLEYIPDNETEVYFKAADVLILPYRDIFESGVLYLAYRFGVPVVASDVGSFREEITNSGIGLVCEAANSTDLVSKVDALFNSGLYKDRELHRLRIREYAKVSHSWSAVAKTTELVYCRMVKAAMPWLYSAR
jgi:D-inositol-3-phosphate glycosyltransferase